MLKSYFRGLWIMHSIISNLMLYKPLLWLQNIVKNVKETWLVGLFFPPCRLGSSDSATLWVTVPSIIPTSCLGLWHPWCGDSVLCRIPLTGTKIKSKVLCFFFLKKEKSKGIYYEVFLPHLSPNDSFFFFSKWEVKITKQPFMVCGFKGGGRAGVVHFVKSQTRASPTLILGVYEKGGFRRWQPWTPEVECLLGPSNSHVFWGMNEARCSNQKDCSVFSLQLLGWLPGVPISLSAVEPSDHLHYVICWFSVHLLPTCMNCWVPFQWIWGSARAHQSSCLE